MDFVNHDKITNSQLRDAVRKKDVPYCTLCLVLMICICHSIVLVGNWKTAEGFTGIGVSTNGWSSVGLNLSQSLQLELNGLMKNLSAMLTDAINHTMHAQKMLDTVVGLQGHAVDAVLSNSSTKAIALLQVHGMMDASQIPKALPGLVTKSVNTVLDMLMNKTLDALDILMVKLKPALLQVGEFITKFGEKIQTIIEHFSVTLDRVQKIFDQVMSNLASKGGNREDLEHETWHLFDASNSGAITAQDLKDVGQLYSVPALKAKISDDLVAKYDADKSGDLNRQEFNLMVTDPAIPNCMSVVLRSFAKTLSSVAGQVGGSKFRGEIAADVADYLALMAQKNMTKVSWIADALTNASLPLEFTADVLANLALKEDDPNVLAVVSTGKVVVREMLRIHPQEASKAVDLLSNSSYWLAEGFSPSDHAEVTKRVTLWASQPQTIVKAAIGYKGALTLLEEKSLEDASTMVMQRKLLNAMPGVAYTLAKERMQSHLDSVERLRRAHYDTLYESDMSQHLLLHLMGGERALQDGTTSPADQMVKTGVLAHPSTLQFAQWLSFNASNTANRFQKMSFEYQKTSSNAIDSFATQIQGMVKKMQGFIKLMEQYSTPDGIQALEDTISDFGKHAAKDVLKVIKNKVGKLMNDSTPALESGLHDAIHAAGMRLGNLTAKTLASPLGSSLATPIRNILANLVGNTTATELGGEISKVVSGDISNIAGKALGEQIGKLLDKLVNKALATTAGVLQMPVSNFFGSAHLEGLTLDDRTLVVDIEREFDRTMRQAHNAMQIKITSSFDNSRSRGTRGLLALTGDSFSIDRDDDQQLSGAWEQLVATLKSLTHVIPQANKAMLSARKEVGMLSKNLDSIFDGLQKGGPPIFVKVSSLWRSVFTLYFFVTILFPLTLLFYAFWAGGFMEGAGTLPKSEVAAAHGSRTLWMKCKGCLAACCYCAGGCHGSPAKANLCFWSVCLLMQIVVLLLFLLSLIFCLLTAVKMFLAAGCAQIYLLGDASVCGTTLGNLRLFLNTFLGNEVLGDLGTHCVDASLLTCDLIGSKMKSSGLLTAIGSFLAALFTFQLLIESAAMHERAVNRTVIADCFIVKQKSDM